MHSLWASRDLSSANRACILRIFPASTVSCCVKMPRDSDVISDIFASIFSHITQPRPAKDNGVKRDPSVPIIFFCIIEIIKIYIELAGSATQFDCTQIAAVMDLPNKQ